MKEEKSVFTLPTRITTQFASQTGISMDPAQAIELEEIARHRNINEMIARGNSPVQQFYSNAVVLITGGSGFLGKQLIEKLFRSCSIKKIYILLRPKKLKCLEERVNDILQDKLFEHLHKTQPDFVSKLIPIEGDITHIQLGLTKQNWDMLTQEINIIFHVAAIVNFVEPLKSATLTNIRGTREMLVLARSCKQLISFVHISTAYVHATTERVNQPVLEQFYDCPLTPHLLIELAEQFDEQKLDTITPKLISNWPNTYAFTKALAEELLRSTAGDLPVCIVRPAIVMQAYREPPGWVDKTTMNGPVGFIVGACLGGLHVMYANKDTLLDVVPVDIVNNAAIVAAYETAKRRQCDQTDIKIYTVTSSRISILVDTLHQFLETDARNLMTPKLFWHGYVILTGSKLIFLVLAWLLQFIPGYLVDFLLKLSGRKPKAIRLLQKAYKQNQVFGFYLTNSFKFGDSNLLQMYDDLSPVDRVIYFCDTAGVEVDRYMPVCCIGARKYILNDGLQNTNYAIRKAYWLRILNAIFLTIYCYGIWKVLCLCLAATQFILSNVLCLIC